jgi:hypothetical protein
MIYDNDIGLRLQRLAVPSSRQFQHETATAELDTNELPHTAASLLPLPPAAASTSEKIQFLHQQLDSMGDDAEFLPGLIMLGGGNKERLQGGALQCLEN